MFLADKNLLDNLHIKTKLNSQLFQRSLAPAPVTTERMIITDNDDFCTQQFDQNIADKIIRGARCKIRSKADHEKKINILLGKEIYFFLKSGQESKRTGYRPLEYSSWMWLKSHNDACEMA